MNPIVDEELGKLYSWFMLMSRETLQVTLVIWAVSKSCCDPLSIVTAATCSYAIS